MRESGRDGPLRKTIERFGPIKQELLRLFVHIVAITCVCMALGGYIGYARLGEIAGYPVFLSLYFSSTVLFCGLALYAARTYTLYARRFALIVILVMTWAYIAPQWFGAWQNGRIISAVFGTVLVLSGAVAALLLRHKVKPRVPAPASGPAWMAWLGISVVTLITYGLIEDNIITRQQFVKREAEAVAHDIQGRIKQATGLMRRLSERWATIEHIPTQALIEREFDSYMRDFSFFDSLAIVDGGSIARQDDRTGFFRGWDGRSAPDARLQDWLTQVHDSGDTHVAVDEHILQNGNAGLVATPLSNPKMKGWLVMARLSLADIFAQATSRAQDGYFLISHGGHVLYRTAGALPKEAFAAGDITIPAHHDFNLELDYVYSNAPSELSTEILPEFVLLAGMIFTFLLISSQRLAYVARERSLQLHHSALHDPLTGLPNRRMLEQILRDACARAKSEGTSVSVVFFDLDGIKLINDSMGHAIGDGVLVEVANRLQRGLPKDGNVTRLGGDEFVLLFSGIGTEQVQELTQRVIIDLSEPYLIGDRVLRVTASAGIATRHGHFKDPMQLVREADLAMLRAKQEGRNTWHAYTVDLSSRVADRLELRNDLQSALEEEGLELHYQPIIAGHSGQVVGVEALVRWPHPTRGYMEPSRFIRLAEETGQIIPLTEWVLAAACRARRILSKQGFPAFPVIVNISPLYFQRADFVQDIRQALDHAALPAELFEIEITEGVLLDNEEAAILKLAQLRELGIRTSIDDFGTGYSSLNYLKNLPIDKVKIDRSFVVDVVSDPGDAAIAQGVISMAHHLGLKVVAEGVETESQFSFLKRSHCDEFQGYLLARPMSFNKLVTMLSENGCRVFPPQPLIEPASERVLLLVDDEKNILNALTRLLRRDGYRILTASGPAQAFELLAQHRVQVIVSDQRMPEMTGTEFFSKVKEIYPATTRMILSGYTDLKSVTDAINRGAIYKFITKPWDDEALRKDIEHAFISQRDRDAQEILNVEREQLRRLFQQAPGFVCILRGPQHIYELANDAYYQLIGHRQVLGCVLAEALPEVVEQGYLEKLDRVFATGKPFVGRAMPIQLQRSVGGALEQCYVDLIYQPIRDAGGQVSGIFVQGHDVTEAHQLAQKISYQATHDSLTGLFNRQEFERRSRELEALEDPHVLLYIDMDHFKIVNDRGSHAAGDALLRHVAAILRQHVRKSDLLARLGGDEFALVLSGCSEKDGLERAQLLCRKVRNLPFVWGDSHYSVTLSIGLVEFGALRSLSFAEAFSLADVACFLAKEKGRNRVQVSDPTDIEITGRQSDMDRVALINECIREDRVVLYVQRFTAMHMQRHDGVECWEVLARLLDADANLILPQSFIAAAERFGIIQELDRHIVHKAFSKLNSLAASLRVKTRYFINVSGTTLSDPDFCAYVALMLTTYPNVRPSNVCFEVTETAAISNSVHMAETCRHLVERGFSFALDDFGSGMSSLSYLRQLPIHYIKIDGQLIKDMLARPAGATIVEAVVKVAGSMNILTVAESVEYPELLPRLQEIGVDYGQGFALRPPEPL